MTEDEAVAAVIEWAEETVPELGEPRRDQGSSWPLPDVACAIRRSTRGAVDLEQVVEARREVDLIVAVHPQPHDAAQSNLYGFMQQLMDGLLADTTLGGRAHIVVPRRPEPVCTVAYGEAESELPGGGTADAAVLSFTLRDEA